MPEVSSDTNRAAAPVQLAPPRAPLPESFWWTYRLEIAAGLLLIAAAVIVAIALGRRRKPVLRVAPAVQARKELEILRMCGSGTGLPVEIARVIRRFVVNRFELAPGEMTTAELGKALSKSNGGAADAAGLVAGFLQRCDVMKFAPAATAAGTDLVAEAMELVEQVEKFGTTEGKPG